MYDVPGTAPSTCLAVVLNAAVPTARDLVYLRFDQCRLVYRNVGTRAHLSSLSLLTSQFSVVFVLLYFEE